MTYVLLFAVATTCFAQSVSTLSTELQKSPSASRYADRAAAYLAAGDPKGALADTDRALDKDALNVRALVLRAQANSKLNRFSAAITDLSGAIALSPNDAALYMARSYAYASISDEPRALADRNEALRLDANVVATMDRKLTEAPAPVQVAAVAPPPTRETTVVIPPPTAPKTAPTKPPVATAPHVSTEATSTDPYQRAKTLLNEGKNSDAVAAMDEAIQAQPKNPVFYNTRGYARFLAKDIKGALQDYDEAIKLNPDYLNATQNRATARRAAGDKAGSDADKKRAAELSKK
jgi:tetratricopeptide (TPR) repeat protein